MDQGHVVLADSSRPRKPAATRIGDVDPAARMEVTLTLRGPQLPELDTHEPAISRADFESRYGADPDDLVKVEKTLERFGLKVEGVTRAARSVRVSGTATQMEDAFRAGLGVYRDEDQGEFRGREKDVQVPAELDGVVTGVFGLDERRVARRGGGTPAASRAQTARAAALTPSDFERRYSFPAGTCKGQRVGIAEFGGTYFPDDLREFCAREHLSQAKVQTVDAGLAAPTIAEIERMPEAQREEVLNDSVEVMMDIEIVAGLCPDAEILVYFATFDEKGWMDLLGKVIAGEPAAPSVLSVSWGLAEDSSDWSRAAVKEVNRHLQAAAHLGVTVCVASGDDGSGDQVQDGRAHVNFPASSPFVLSVGGTMLEGGKEVVWWQRPGQRQGGGGATGGGVSTVFARPAWQDVHVDSLNEGSIDGRVVPDVAALAGPPYYDLVTFGKPEPNGGTSAATPLWAAMIARTLAAGKPAQGPTFLAPLLYEAVHGGEPRGRSACTDIVNGNNASSPQPGTGYEAGPGYDAVSGWGAPDGQKLLVSL
jgi:kumamolisin